MKVRMRFRFRCRPLPLLLLVLAALLAAPAAGVAAGDYFIIGPHVTAVGPAEATLVWVAPAGAEAGIATLIGPDDSRQRTPAVPGVPRFQRRGADDLAYVRQLVSWRDLAPFTTYRYEVTCARGEASRTGSFRTAPVPGARDPFRFVVIGDTHGGHDEIAAAVAAENPDFVVHTGDFAGGRGHDWGGWLSYFRSARPYLESSVIRPVVGGHDVRPARNFRALFAFDDPGAAPDAGDGAATWYSFTFGNLLYLVLDYTAELDEQVDWVRGQLAATEAEWIFVSLHDSIFTVGGRGSVLNRPAYRELAALFEAHGVAVVIFGHDHVYERSLPIGGPGTTPVHYITTNAGGNFRVVRPSPVVAGGSAVRALCYAVFDIAADQLRLAVREADGTVIDRLELHRGADGAWQPEIMARAVDRELALKIAHLYTAGSFGAYDRSDISAEFSAFPRPGEPLTVLLDVAGFPAGSRLRVFPPEGDAWSVEEDELAVTGETAAVRVTVPAEAVYAEGQVRPPLRLGLNLVLDGRLFEPVTVVPTLGPRTLDWLSLETLPEKIGLRVREYDRDLVPAAPLAGPGEPAFSGNITSRGPQHFYTWVDQAPATLTLSVTGGGISASRYRQRGDFHLELCPVTADGPGEPVASVPVRRDGRAAELSLEAGAPGLHLLRFDDNRDRTTLDWPAGLPLTLRVAPDDYPAYPTEIASLPDLVFYVPPGVRRVEGHAWARRGRMLDGAGEPVFDFERFQGFFRVPVPDGGDGAFWQLRGYTGRLYFTSVPPYLARSPAELLLPRAVVEQGTGGE